jgi:hypothetical protein
VKGRYFPPTSVLIAGGERERERSRSRTSTTAGRWLTGAVGLRRAPEPLFSVNDGWASADNLKLAQPKRPNGYTVVTLTSYHGLNKFQIELSRKIEKAYFYCSKNSHIFHATRVEDEEQLLFSNQVLNRI